MQAGHTTRLRGTGFWLLLLAVVAVICVGLGRWVVPAEGTTGPSHQTSIRAVRTVPDALAERLMIAKLERMDAEDERHEVHKATTPESDRHSQLREEALLRKLERMDAEDNR